MGGSRQAGSEGGETGHAGNPLQKITPVDAHGAPSIGVAALLDAERRLSWNTDEGGLVKMTDRMEKSGSNRRPDGKIRRDVSIDRLDRRLLNLLQENNQRTSEQLGAAVGLSTTSCQRRVRRLREIGAITEDVSIVSPSVIGHDVTAIVHISLEREQHNLLDEFKRRMTAYPEVTQCYYVTGHVDFILIVRVPSMEEYGAFTERAFFSDKNVRSFQTFVSMRTIKYTTKIAIDEE